MELYPLVDPSVPAEAKIQTNISEFAEPRTSTGPEIDAFVESILADTTPAKSGRDRRTRARAKIDLGVHVRGGIGTLQAYEDLVHSVDATRDGLLISTTRTGYWVGEQLRVTFPYWATPTAINKPRRATVLRCAPMRDMQYGLAVKFEEGKGKFDDLPWSAAPFANQVRVLGVESDPHMAQAMQELLEQDGYCAVFVSSAQEALDILRDETPDVILADAEGGEISGQDLCAIVKKNDRLKHIPVILLIGSAVPSDFAASHEVGAVVCMTKPYQTDRLQRAVHLVAAPPGATHRV